MMPPGAVASSRRRNLLPGFIDATFYSNTTGQAAMLPIIPTGVGRLYLLLASNNSTAQYTKNNPANGWALASAVDASAATDTTVRGMALWTHVGTGSEGAAGATVAFTRTVNTTGLSMAIMVRLSNPGTLQSIRLASATGINTITLGSKDAVVNNTMALQLVMHGTAGTADWVEPVGTTNHEEGNSAGGTRMAVGSDRISVGASGDRIWTRDTAGASRGAMLLINPAA